MNVSQRNLLRGVGRCAAIVGFQRRLALQLTSRRVSAVVVSQHA
jgi:hypothetical protein